MWSESDYRLAVWTAFNRFSRWLLTKQRNDSRQVKPCGTASHFWPSVSGSIGELSRNRRDERNDTRGRRHGRRHAHYVPPPRISNFHAPGRLHNFRNAFAREREHVMHAPAVVPPRNNGETTGPAARESLARVARARKRGGGLCPATRCAW